MKYPSHDFVITFEETKKIGLIVDLLPNSEEEKVWSLYQEYQKRLNDVVLIVEIKDYNREIRKPKVTNGNYT